MAAVQFLNRQLSQRGEYVLLEDAAHLLSTVLVGAAQVQGFPLLEGLFDGQAGGGLDFRLGLGGGFLGLGAFGGGFLLPERLDGVGPLPGQGPGLIPLRAHFGQAGIWPGAKIKLVRFPVDLEMEAEPGYSSSGSYGQDAPDAAPVVDGQLAALGQFGFPQGGIGQPVLGAGDTGLWGRIRVSHFPGL